jgi:hypothetical protein
VQDAQKCAVMCGSVQPHKEMCRNAHFCALICCLCTYVLYDIVEEIDRNLIKNYKIPFYENLKIPTRHNLPGVPVPPFPQTSFPALLPNEFCAQRWSCSWYIPCLPRSVAQQVALHSSR